MKQESKGKYMNLIMFTGWLVLLTGDAAENQYQTMKSMENCDLWQVGEEFSRKPFALAVQNGSPLRNDLSTA